MNLHESMHEKTRAAFAIWFLLEYRMRVNSSQDSKTIWLLRRITILTGLDAQQLTLYQLNKWSKYPQLTAQEKENNWDFESQEMSKFLHDRTERANWDGKDFEHRVHRMQDHGFNCKWRLKKTKNLHEGREFHCHFLVKNIINRVIDIHYFLQLFVISIRHYCVYRKTSRGTNHSKEYMSFCPNVPTERSWRHVVRYSLAWNHEIYQGSWCLFPALNVFVVETEGDSRKSGDKHSESRCDFCQEFLTSALLLEDVVRLFDPACSRFSFLSRTRSGLE